MLTLNRARRLRRLIAFAIPPLLGAFAVIPSTPVSAAQPPSVATVSPGAGTECGGTTVTLTGANLNNATEVDFGSVQVFPPFISDTGTQLQVSAPPHDPGSVVPEVFTAAGNSGTTPLPGNVNVYQFTDQSPVITSISPTSGNQAGGTSVTINGSCFVDSTNIQFVQFGSSQVSPDSVTNNVVTATAPAQTPQTVSVTVKTFDGRTSTAASYTYVAPATVTAIQDTTTSSTSGPSTGGDTVLITGAGYGSVLSCNISKVTFGGVAATIQAGTCGLPSQSNPQQQTIKVTTPAAANTAVNSSVDVQVWDCGDCGSATSAADLYDYLAAPTVTALSTRGGPQAGGTPVTVSGTNFTAPDGSCQVQHVYFGGTNAATGLTNCTPTSIDVTSPPGSSIVDVRVVTNGGESAVNQPADQFTYAGVAVTSVSPDGGLYTGTAKDAIRVLGFGFSFGGVNDVTTVTFGTGPGSPTGTDLKFVSDSEVDVTAPAGVPGTVDVIVATAHNGSSTANPPADNYTFSTLPSVSGVSPTFGPSAGGNKVTISGSGFDGGTSSCDVNSVSFGGQSAVFNPATDCTDTAITVTVPGIPTPASGSSAVTVNVTTDAGSDGGSTQYTYVAAPTVASVSPSSGPLAGGNTVTVNGAHFFSDKGSCDVKSVAFGGSAGSSPTCTSDSALTVTAPAGSGTVDVTVTTNDGGTSSTSPADQYTFTNACNTPSGTVSAGSGSGGTAYSQPTGSSWNLEPGSANYIAAGGGQVFVLGTNAVGGGFQPYRWNGSGWDAYPGGLVDLAVGPDGSPWGVNSSQQIYHWSAGAWQLLPGSAYDIAVGPAGSAFVLGTNAVGGGCAVYRWNGAGWSAFGGGGIQLAVAGNDYPWVINNTQSIWAYNGSGWSQEPGAAQMIAATAGSVWVLGTNAVGGGWGVYYFTGSGWGSIPGGGTSIAVGSARLPWLTNSSRQIYQRT